MDDSPTQKNLILLRRFLTEVLEGGNLDLVDELFAENFAYHRNTKPPLAGGRERYKERMRRLRAAWPDRRDTVTHMFGADDYVAVRVESYATHQGPIYGIPATGRPVMWVTNGIFQLAEGRITEAWVSEDTFAMLQQMDVVAIRPQAELAAPQTPDGF